MTTARKTPRARRPAAPAKAAATPATPPAKAAKAAKAPKAPTATKPAKAARPTPEPAAAAKPAKPAKAPKPAKPEAKPPKVRPRLVRDGFTMPESDFSLIGTLKARALGAAHPAKKSELLRAGLHALSAMDTPTLVAALSRLEPVKTGRPKKGA